MKWDPFGERLALTFRDSNLLALFCTVIRPSLSLTPLGLLRGIGDERPNCMEFARKFEQGALLTVVRYFTLIKDK